MRLYSSRFGGLLLAVMSLTSILPAATVTNIAWYRLGEDDPGAASGVTVSNMTLDFIGANHLQHNGTLLYTNAISSDAAGQAGSSLAVAFNGSGQYFSNVVVSSAVDNFGIEAWVRPNTTNSGPQLIVENGSAAGGWGLYQNGSGYFARFGGVTVFGGGTASPGTWAHVALVRDNSMSTLHVNGVPAGTIGSAPNPPAGVFGVGALALPPATWFFNGIIDEVRIFTFAPGEFNSSFLLLSPRVQTLVATEIAPPNAMLNGKVSPAGLPTSVWFEWGTTTNFGTTTPVLTLAEGIGSTNVSQSVTEVLGGTTYYFRTVASNSLGVVAGSNAILFSPTFTLANSFPYTNHYGGAVSFVDYNEDGKMDVCEGARHGPGLSGSVVLWRNTNNVFPINYAFALISGTVSHVWGDYGRDGKMDVLIIRDVSGYPPVLRNYSASAVYPTNNGGLPSMYHVEFLDPFASWGDVDRDGREDLIFNGTQPDNISPVQAQLYLAHGLGDDTAGFVRSFLVSNVTALVQGDIASADFDKDGWLDMAQLGFNVLTGERTTEVWRNTGRGFTNVQAGLPGVGRGSVDWGDYDNDGLLDILLTGEISNSNWVAHVWRNTGSGFSNINAGLPGVRHGDAAWADYDNDGLLDIALAGSGSIPTNGITEIWRNTGSGFSRLNVDLPGAPNGASVAWGDFDDDGRVDLLFAGDNIPTQLWRNNTPITNSPPTVPANLTVDGGILRWSPASDLQTPSSGLTYNVRIGTYPGSQNIVSPNSLNSGRLLVPRRGNSENRTFFVLPDRLQQGRTYYAAVQAVDGAFAGSAYSPEISFTTHTVTAPPTALTPTLGDQNGDGIVDQWELATVLTSLNGNGVVTEAELGLVLSNYWPNSPWLQMTNTAGLGGTNVTFALNNSTAGEFSVEYTTNLADWYDLGPAVPRYLFTDTNAPAVPQRYYRLRWP